MKKHLKSLLFAFLVFAAFLLGGYGSNCDGECVPTAPSAEVAR